MERTRCKGGENERPDETRGRFSGNRLARELHITSLCAEEKEGKGHYQSAFLSVSVRTVRRLEEGEGIQRTTRRRNALHLDDRSRRYEFGVSRQAFEVSRTAALKFLKLGRKGLTMAKGIDVVGWTPMMGDDDMFAQEVGNIAKMVEEVGEDHFVRSRARHGRIQRSAAELTSPPPTSTTTQPTIPRATWLGRTLPVMPQLLRCRKTSFQSQTSRPGRHREAATV